MPLRPNAVLDAVRLVALGLFALAHMQDVSAMLAPASLALVLLTYAPDLILYRRPTAEMALMALFCGYFLALILINNSLDNATFVDFMKKQGKILYTMSVFLAFAHIRPGARVEPLLFRGSLAAGSGVTLASLYSIRVHPLAIGEVKLSDGHEIMGLLGTHNAVAASLGTLLLLALAAWAHEFEKRRPRLLGSVNLLLLGLVFLGFVAAKSRGWLMGVAASSLPVCIGIVRRDPRMLRVFAAVLLVLGAVGAIIVLTRDSKQSSKNVSVRIRVWERAAGLIITSPLVGIGPGAFEELNGQQATLVPNLIAVRTSGKAPNALNYQNEYSGIHPHNSYLQILLDYGLLGLGLYALILTQAAKRARFVARRIEAAAGGGGPLLQLADLNAKVVLLTIIYMIVGSLTNGYVFYGPVCPLYLFVCLGRLTAQTEALLSSP